MVASRIILPLLSCLLISLSMDVASREIILISLSPISYAAANRAGYMVFFWSGFLVNIVFQTHYLKALFDYLGPLYGGASYIAIVIAMAAPYALISPIVRLKCISSPAMRVWSTILLTASIWLITDNILPSKYWIELAESPWALWFVREGGELLLVAIIGLVSALLSFLFILDGLILRLCSGITLVLIISLLHLITPGLSDHPHRLPGAVVGVQLGRNELAEAKHGLISGEYNEITTIKNAFQYASRNLLPGWLGVIPELTYGPMIDDNADIMTYKSLTEIFGFTLLINGSVHAPDGRNLIRASSVISPNSYPLHIVKKSHLVPFFESMENEDGIRYIEGRDFDKFIYSEWGSIQSLLCLELFDRYFLSHSKTPITLVVVAADTSKFNHGSVSRHILHTAMFQAQVAKAPVLVVDYGGPSFISWPDGVAYQITSKDEKAAFIIYPDGNTVVIPEDDWIVL